MIRKYFFNPLTSLFILFFLLATLLFPDTTSVSVRCALSLCADRVIPSLFPFLVLTRIIADMRICSPLELLFRKFMNPFFSLSDASITPLLLGFISGYPIGAAMCTSEYQNGHLKKREAERLLAFSNNAGPAFILSTIGATIFSSLKIGFALLVIHISSAILVGLIFRIISPLPATKKSSSDIKTKKAFSFALTDAVYEATKSSLSITAYIAFFAVFTSVSDILFSAKLFYLTNNFPVIKAVFNGVFELTSGAFLLSEKANPEAAFILISMLLGWGGFCIHFQAMSFVKKTDLKMNEYFAGKFMQAFISGIIAYFTAKSHFFDAIYTFSESIKTNQFNLLPGMLLFFVVSVCIFSKKGGKVL